LHLLRHLARHYYCHDRAQPLVGISESTGPKDHLAQRQDL
jgi:hypothetical protein